jgi:hypothetical protein
MHTFHLQANTFVYVNSANANAHNAKISFLPNAESAHIGNNKLPGENMKNRKTNSGVYFTNLITK